MLIDSALHRLLWGGLQISVIDLYSYYVDDSNKCYVLHMQYVTCCIKCSHALKIYWLAGGMLMKLYELNIASCWEKHMLDRNLWKLSHHCIYLMKIYVYFWKWNLVVRYDLLFSQSLSLKWSLHTIHLLLNL